MKNMKFNICFIILIILISYSSCFAQYSSNYSPDTIMSNPIIREDSNSFTLKNKEAVDSFLYKNQKILIYYFPCVFNGDGFTSDPARLAVVTENKQIFVYDIPASHEVCDGAGGYTSYGFSHKQVNGTGFPEIIIEYDAQLCGASGVLCHYSSGIKIIDIESSLCLLDAITYIGEENNAGRYGGDDISYSYSRNIKIHNGEIDIGPILGKQIWHLYKDSTIILTPKEISDVFPPNEGEEEFYIRPGKYKWINGIFIKQK